MLPYMIIVLYQLHFICTHHAPSFLSLELYLYTSIHTPISTHGLTDSVRSTVASSATSMDPNANRQRMLCHQRMRMTVSSYHYVAVV